MHGIFIIHPSISPNLANRVFSVPQKFSGDGSDYSIQPPVVISEGNIQCMINTPLMSPTAMIENKKKKGKEKKDYQWEPSHPDRVSSFFLFLKRGEKKEKKARPTSDMLTSALSSMKISRFDDQGNQSEIFLWLEACRSSQLAPGKKHHSTRKQGVYFVLAPEYPQIHYHIFLFHPCFRVLLTCK